jgi:PAS domain S-box-containing protein
MDSNFLSIDIVGSNNSQIKRNKILHLLSITFLTLSFIVGCKLLIHSLFPNISREYYEMTIILSSCLAVNIAASLILYRYRIIMGQLESRLELKSDNLSNTIKTLKVTREERRRYLMELKRIDEKYRSFLDNIDEGTVSLDAEGNFLGANKKMQELLGFSEAELLSMNLMQFLPEEGLKRIKATLNKVVQAGEGSLADGWIIGKNGQRFPVAFFGSKVQCADKTLIQGIFRDTNGSRLS